MAVDNPQRIEPAAQEPRRERGTRKGMVITIAVLVAIALAIGGTFAFNAWQTNKWYAANLKIGLVVHPVSDVDGYDLASWASAGLGPVYASMGGGHLISISPTGKAITHELVSGGKRVQAIMPVAAGVGGGATLATTPSAGTSSAPAVVTVNPTTAVVSLPSGTTLPIGWTHPLEVGIGPFNSIYVLAAGTRPSGTPVPSNAQLAVLRLDSHGAWGVVWHGQARPYRSMAVQSDSGNVYLYHYLPNAAPRRAAAAIDLLTPDGTLRANWATVDVFVNGPFVASNEGSVYIAGMGAARRGFPIGPRADGSTPDWPTLIRIDPSGHQTYWLLVDSKGAPVLNTSVQLGPTANTLYVDAASSSRLIGGAYYFKMSTITLPFDWRTGN